MFPTLLSLGSWAGWGAPSELLSTPHPAPEDCRATPLWPQGTSLPTSPLQRPPHLTQTYCYKKGKRKNSQHIKLSSPPAPTLRSLPPTHEGQDQRPSPGSLGGSRSSPSQEKKVPSGQVTTPQTLAGLGHQKQRAEPTGPAVPVAAAPGPRKTWRQL